MSTTHACMCTTRSKSAHYRSGGSKFVVHYHWNNMRMAIELNYLHVNVYCLYTIHALVHMYNRVCFIGLNCLLFYYQLSGSILFLPINGIMLSSNTVSGYLGQMFHFIGANLRARSIWTAIVLKEYIQDIKMRCLQNVLVNYLFIISYTFSTHIATC